jgi:hypothetical protein
MVVWPAWGARGGGLGGPMCSRVSGRILDMSDSALLGEWQGGGVGERGGVSLKRFLIFRDTFWKPFGEKK